MYTNSKASGHKLLSDEDDDIQEIYVDMEKLALFRIEESSEGRVDNGVST
jgi:hypothetical protein